MSWGSWIARGVGYGLAPFTGGLSAGIGEAVAQGIDAKDATKKANTQQQTATTGASQQLDKGQAVNTAVYDQQMGTAADVYNRQQQTNGDVLNQQRQDYQALANAPYQTLGAALGIDIPDVTPVAFTNQAPMSASGAGGTLASAAIPSGAGLHYAAPGEQLQAGVQANPLGVIAPAAKGSLLKPNTMSDSEWSALSIPERQQVSKQQSASSYAKVQGPDGSVKDVPEAIARLLVKQGLKVVA